MGQSSTGGASAGMPETAPTAGLQAMFANNQAPQRNQVAPLTQPLGNPVPSLTQQTMGSASRPPAFAPMPSSQNSGVQGIYDAQAKANGFRDSASEQGFLGTLTKDQQNLYRQPDSRQSGSSLMSPTNAPYHVQDPSIMQAQTIWNLKQQYPDLFGGGGGGQTQQAPQISTAQRLAQQMNQR